MSSFNIELPAQTRRGGHQSIPGLIDPMLGGLQKLNRPSALLPLGVENFLRD